MKGVDVLDMVDALDCAAVALQVQLFVVDTHLAGYDAPGAVCVATDGRNGAGIG